MAGSGSAWIKPTKRSGLRPDRLADRPHPAFIRPGQRYYPLRGSGKTRATIKIMRAVSGEQWDGTRDDGRRVRIVGARVLATHEDGLGRYYRFVGYSSRRYDTHGVVLETDSSWTRLVLPEWHPGLRVTVGTGTVPPSCREPGSWVRCRANLGAERPAHLEVDRIGTPQAGFDPAIYPDVTVEAAAAIADGEPPALGPGCGDVVLFVSAAEAEMLASGQADEVYVTGHPPPLSPGARVYLHGGGRMLGWRPLSARRPRPNGTRLSFGGSLKPCTVPTAIERPPSGVAQGEHGRQQWVWRSWPREAERAGELVV